MRAAGLSPPSALVNSSLDEEESEGERSTSDTWEPAAPPLPGVKGVVAKPTLEVSEEPPIAGGASRCCRGARRALEEA